MSSNDIPMPKQVNIPRPTATRSKVEEKIHGFAELLVDAQDERDVALRERDHYKAEYEKAVDICSGAKGYLVGLEAERDDLKRRCADYQRERDKAVVELAEVFTTLKNAAEIIARKIKSPPQYVAPNAEATSPRQDAESNAPSDA